MKESLLRKQALILKKVSGIGGGGGRGNAMDVVTQWML